MEENRRFDEEWVKLITEARDLGISKEDIRSYLQSTIKNRHDENTVETFNIK